MNAQVTTLMGTFTKGGERLGWGGTGEGPLTQRGELVGKASLEEALEGWALAGCQELARQTPGGTLRELSRDSHVGLGEQLVTLKSWHRDQTAGRHRCP